MSEKTSISDIEAYRRICLAAATDDKAFGNFRKQPLYVAIVETVNGQEGAEHFTIAARNSPEIISHVEEFRQNDLYGSPQLFRYSDIGIFAPTTLRYVKIAVDIQRMFGDLTGMRIAEIGVGYGGQCRILNSLFKIKSYDLFDLKEALMLTRRYLENFGLDNLNYCDIGEGCFEGYDLVISNYAISEIGKSSQDQYIEKVISKSKHGFIIYNQETFKKSHPDFSYEIDDFLERVPQSRRSTIWLDHVPSNSLVFW